MSETAITTDEIPKLSHGPSPFALRRSAIEIALLAADSWNAALGLDIEPNRSSWRRTVPATTAGTGLGRRR
jgi:hypothetical protein